MSIDHIGVDSCAVIVGGAAFQCAFAVEKKDCDPAADRSVSSQERNLLSGVRTAARGTDCDRFFPYSNPCEIDASVR